MSLLDQVPGDIGDWRSGSDGPDKHLCPVCLSGTTALKKVSVPVFGIDNYAHHNSNDLDNFRNVRIRLALLAGPVSIRAGACGILVRINRIPHTTEYFVIPYGWKAPVPEPTPAPSFDLFGRPIKPVNQAR